MKFRITDKMLTRIFTVKASLIYSHPNTLLIGNTFHNDDLPFRDFASTVNVDRVRPRRTKNTKYLRPIFLQYEKTNIIRLFLQEERKAN